MTNKLFEIKIPFNEKNNEIVFNSLYLNDITSFLEEDNKVIFTVEEDNLLVLKFIKKFLVENNYLDINKIAVSEFTDRDWNQEWENTIEPVIIRNKLVVYPSWKIDDIADKKNKILIQVNPKMSFGTGHNETTQLILELLCDHISTDDKFMLDYGCGTSVLAIAGVKLGVEKAVAIDIDDDAIRDSKEYIKLNGVSENISLIKSDIKNIVFNEFDVICVNIISSVIKENIDSIYAKLKTKGKLFLAGILIEESEGIRNLLIDKGFEIIMVSERAEWSSIYAVKN